MEDIIVIQPSESERIKKASLALVEKIKFSAFSARKSIAEGYDGEERYGWSEKSRLAQSCLKDDAEAIATLQIECTTRGDGLSPQQLAQTILDKAKKFRAAELFIRGTQSRLEKAAQDLLDLPEAEAFSAIEDLEAGLATAFDLSKLPELLASNDA